MKEKDVTSSKYKSQFMYQLLKGAIFLQCPESLGIDKIEARVSGDKFVGTTAD